MQDAELLRYSRQIMLPEVDIAGQERMLASHVIIVGLGGLGAPAAMYLAAAGVGRLTLIDDDRVEASNLQRQIIHRSDAVGASKVASAATTLRDLNPGCEVTTIDARIDEQALAGLLTEADLVLDATDNFETRHAINRACRASRVPLVSGAAIRWEGQIAVFDFRVEDGPCYACLYAPDTQGENLNCAENGVAAPIVGVVGAMQALEALKLLTGVGETLHGALLVWDGKYQSWQRLRLQRDPGCALCAAATRPTA
ncbi:MAG: molybdopterin-synthase adenylyltransferase MoeB [Pseudomonadota bacterium]